jgi:DNA-binding NarL/FixJ family response regulator
MIKIIMVDDHHVVRSSIRFMLEHQSEIDVVLETDQAAECLSYLNQKAGVDVVISDIFLPEKNGLDLIREIKKISPGTHVICLSMMEEEQYASDAFLAGASAYLSKSIEAEELLFCIKHVMKGKRYLASALCISILERFNSQLGGRNYHDKLRLNLSERETLVLKGIAEGLTNQEIADKLFLSRRTVETQRENLIAKTGTRNTADLVRFSVLNGLVS